MWGSEIVRMSWYCQNNIQLQVHMQWVIRYGPICVILVWFLKAEHFFWQYFGAWCIFIETNFCVRFGYNELYNPNTFLAAMSSSRSYVVLPFVCSFVNVSLLSSQKMTDWLTDSQSTRINPYQPESTIINLNQSKSTCVNPYQPVSTRINLYQPESTHINLNQPRINL